MRARLRTIVGGLITGALLVGSVWAGAGLVPAGQQPAPLPKPPSLLKPAKIDAGAVSFDAVLPPDRLLAGAAKVDIFPTPDATKGEVWERDRATCLPASQEGINPGPLQDHVADFRIRWAENSNCIYMGGFGIGPSMPVEEWDTEYGLWSRSAAFVRDGKAIVVTILDGEGYFAKYDRMCGTSPCGTFDLAASLAQSTGLAADSFVFASTHAHSAMDFIGGWGGVPQWYMDQVAQAMRSSVLQALGREACPPNQNPLAPTCIPLQEATVEAGDVLARGLNRERRDGYRSAEDPSLNWLRAKATGGSTIATVGTFAAHAVSFGSGAKKAHADWPGIFDKRVEERFGGIGLMFEAGLGNMSTNGGAGIGNSLATLVPDSGTKIASPTVNAAQAFWDQPITNVPLAMLGAPGFFDRSFGGPATVTAAKPGWNKPCVSASAVSARVAVTAARIGNVYITAAPGEVFANFSNTIEERGGLTALAIGQANDALGYMPQSFETDDSARQGGGFVGEGLFNYEDAYSIDRCFGDKALETTITLLGQL